MQCKLQLHTVSPHPGLVATRLAAKSPWPTPPSGPGPLLSPSGQARRGSSSNCASVECSRLVLRAAWASRQRRLSRSDASGHVQAEQSGVSRVDHAIRARNSWQSAEYQRQEAGGASFAPATVPSAIGAARSMAQHGKRCSWP